MEFEFGNEASQDAQDYVSTILQEIESWQFVGPASHSFVQRKEKVEKAVKDDNNLAMEIEQLEEAVALRDTSNREEVARP